MWKRKILIQICICILIIVGYVAIKDFGGTRLQEKSQSAVAAMSKHYTLEDVWENGKRTASAIIKAPVTVTSYVISSQDTQKYGEPVDDVESGETTSVYAVAGGLVIETGSNEEIGNYIKIRHDDAISTYGNCKTIYGKEGEHVRKGQVIASFQQGENIDFYYDLKDK